jgi:hypothetical protein
MRALKTLAILGAVAAATPALAETYSYGSSVSVPGFPLNIFPGAGPASAFPIAINVSGAPAVTTGVELVLTGLKHSFADDLAIALQGPTGLAVLVLTDAGGRSNFDGNYTFSFNGDLTLGNGNFGGNNTVITPGSYNPAVYGFNPIADLLTSDGSLDLFNGLNPNGTWKVWIWDDQIGNVGSIAGISLNITGVSGIAAVPEPATWAMMIGGFALAGLQMRRRKTATVSFA